MKGIIDDYVILSIFDNNYLNIYAYISMQLSMYDSMINIESRII